MSILLDKDTRVLVQGITGRIGRIQTGCFQHIPQVSGRLRRFVAEPCLTVFFHRDSATWTE